MTISGGFRHPHVLPRGFVRERGGGVPTAGPFPIFKTEIGWLKPSTWDNNGNIK